VGIFKAYDIRGVYPTELDENMAYDIGRAAATFLKVKEIVVGYDMRTSTPIMSQKFMEGLTDCGVDVIDIGMCSSPAVYFTVGHYGYPAGAMVTASHNPAKYNGFKFCRENVIPISGETGIKDMQKMVETQEFAHSDTKGTVTQKDILSDYVNHILSFAKDIKPLKIIVDAGNGVAGKFVEEVYKHLPCELTPLYFEPDGTFPHHEANPLKEENLKDLKEHMKTGTYDIGIAFDGDADRIAFVDEKGQTITNDLISALIAQEILSQKSPQTIVYDLRSSWVVPEEVEKHGGIAIESRVGHSFIKGIMRENDAALGGELSGHYYFRDNFYADNAQIAMIKILNLVSRDGRPISEIVQPLRRYFATGEINFKVADKDKKIKELAETFKDGKVYYLDGISVEYSDWWFNVRPSNTEPALRLNLEAKSKELMEQKKSELVAILEQG